MKTFNRFFCSMFVLLIAGQMIIAAETQQAAPNRDDSFSIIILPDTQCYADTRLQFSLKHWKKNDLHKTFLKQTEWIKENKEKLNISMVLHVGDVVQADYDTEWQIADQAFKTLDDVVPYCVAIGNHDMGFVPAKNFLSYPKFAATRETKYNKYFGPARFEGKPWYGGHMGQGSENSFSLFDSGIGKLIVISLEFKPSDEAIAWANKIVAEHEDRRCIVLTHVYLDENNNLSSKLDYGISGNAGEAIWAKFVSLHKNIFLVCCSHEYGERRLTSTGKNGNTIYQLSANYENVNGGDGYLRIMTFLPDKNIIDVKTYSPVLDKYQTGTNSQFSVEYTLK